MNRGNAALLISRIETIRSFCDVSVFYLPYLNSPDSIPSIKSNIKPFKRIGIISPSFLALKTPIQIFCSILWALSGFSNRFDFIVEWDEGLRAFKDADIIVTTGGDVLSEDYGIFNFLTEFCGLFIGILLKKPIFVYAESIGPFKSRVTQFIARSILKRVSVITTRDKISFQYLKELGVSGVPIYLTADSAFLLDKKKVNSPSLNDFINVKRLIGFSINNAISFWKKKDYDKHVNIMVKVIDTIIEKIDANVIIIPHVTIKNDIDNDRIISRKVFSKLKNKKRVLIVDGEYGADEFKYIISCCDLFIGERMHANIAALSTCIPTIAISYSIKTPGLMELVGLPYYSIDFEELNENILVNKILEAWQEREKIKKHLKRVIPKIKKKALKNGKLLKLCIN